MPKNLLDWLASMPLCSRTKPLSTIYPSRIALCDSLLNFGHRLANRGAPLLLRWTSILMSSSPLKLNAGAEVAVVTTNPRHLRPFVDARLWSDIAPE